MSRQAAETYVHMPDVALSSASSSGVDVDERTLRQALFNVDVDIGGGLRKRVVVREGDSALALAQRFVSKHGLGERLTPKLEALLTSRMQEHQHRP